MSLQIKFLNCAHGFTQQDSLVCQDPERWTVPVAGPHQSDLGGKEIAAEQLEVLAVSVLHWMCPKARLGSLVSFLLFWDQILP